MSKDYLEQLEEDRNLIGNLSKNVKIIEPDTIQALKRAIERLDKEIKHVNWCRCQ